MMIQIPDNFLALAYAVLVAVVYGLASYFKTTPKEHFSWAYFLKTIAIGVIVGYAEIQYGMSYDQAIVWATVFTPFIDTLLNSLPFPKPAVSDPAKK
jgi:hypothetical protein